MLIKGEWHGCADGVCRPVVEAYVTGSDGALHRDRFIIDTGADRTVFSASFLKRLAVNVRLPSTGSALAGIGGTTAHVLVRTTLEFSCEDGGWARFNSEFPVFTDPAAADESILGRDVLDHLDLIVSRRRNAVLLLGTNHEYTVAQV